MIIMKFKKLFLGVVLFGLIFSTSVFAQTQSEIDNIISSFLRYKTVYQLPINAPQVIEVPLLDELENSRTDIVVHDKTDNKFVTYYYIHDTKTVELPNTVTAEQGFYNDIVRFVAVPNHDYDIYYYSDKYITPPIEQDKNLLLDWQVMRMAYQSTTFNPRYKVEADMDMDGIPDAKDNCVSIVNPIQNDVDNDGLGDFCDPTDQNKIRNNTQENIVTDIEKNDPKEEKLVIERYQWIPWVGVGIAFVVIVVLFVLTARAVEPKNEK